MTRSPAASASPISFSMLCKMHVFRKIGRLFKIKTHLEAWAVIYAITVGAVYRGNWYLHQYTGVSVWLLFLASTTVVLVVGGFLLDHIPPSPPPQRHKGKNRKNLA